MPSPTRREELKWAAKRRAEMSLAQALQRIDWRLDVIEPEVQEIRAKTKVLDSTGSYLVDAQAALEVPSEAD